MKKKVIATLFASMVALSGCETVTSLPYSASTENVLSMQSKVSKSGNLVRLGEFSENKDVGSLTCRLNGPVDVSPGKTQAQFIKEAMQTELFMAKAYDAASDVEITGNLNSLSFSSVSPASWKLNLTVASNKSAGYTVEIEHPFKTSFSAYGACQNVAQAFAPAVQSLIAEVVKHPDFEKLIGG
ncbi:hypothetical protein EYS14_22485 [Alteromonadaceae bacterium M269]|nr:hypothetical protein EYS14_22485 [Alteromonadaceae bacterium M269]